ncbi:MAG: phenylalanine--tRNA ligase [Methanosarcina sp. 795]|jgi:phenylalanyl-tRNA synthetase beta chain|uniref:Phenylalanine--tRNA ligase beta subunit n=2 Tax=Methanosarcina thermophila TaxID=2210 RepID=A0A3G9CW77_METTE|nr:phenylalanine--tRNA ligase subunit beta [Methanosarcina thermophila]ALK05902.1 MAG: phenylalanine--tRNA ligase [Methanosarcina sp. 795]AKB12575.1 Phenylalanyl-tRNA synthetase beta chain [Methanosarcina thermophila TM-1]NLU56697.1 phenylalanine--tRNA ligase subunit beta [Methanosarcina thermophila]BAW30296.1 phenylalanyl-tRNA synthetase beta subunit [Methanosarcina thermophila]HOQ64764.1 phenylalanine--tRNA ligase subunit beta [Methanosarcina thermophila]
MPVITLQYDDLEKLTGTDKETIINRVPMIGADIERIEEESIDIEFFPDRPDLYSVEGVARAMRGFLDIETGLPEYEVHPSNVSIFVSQDILRIRPFLGSAVVRGVKFTSSSIKSLMDLQEDLHWGLGRNRKKVSIGVHDLSNVKPPFRYMAIDPSFEFVPLDYTEKMSMTEILEKHPKGKRFAHLVRDFDKYPIILDADDNVLSFPPIINGTLTSVTEKTTDLFIDVTGLGEAVYTALNIVVTALAERGGRIESVKVIRPDCEELILPDLEPKSRLLTKSEVKSLLGMELSLEEIVKQLERMRFGAEVLDEEIVEVKVPAYRADILHNYDLIEDIGKGYGYENIKLRIPETYTAGKAHPISLIRSPINEIMVGLGYYEVMPFTLTSEKINFENMRRQKTDDVTHVLHSISEDQTMVRTALLPNLLEILALNQHRELPQKIFEFGEVVRNEITRQHVAAVSIHPQANFTEVYEVVDAFMREMMLPYEVKESEDPAFLEGRRADVYIKGKKIGVFGEFHPEVISNFTLGYAVVGFELDMTDLINEFKLIG